MKNEIWVFILRILTALAILSLGLCDTDKSILKGGFLFVGLAIMWAAHAFTIRVVIEGKVEDSCPHGQDWNDCPDCRH